MAYNFKKNANGTFGVINNKLNNLNPLQLSVQTKQLAPKLSVVAPTKLNNSLPVQFTAPKTNTLQVKTSTPTRTLSLQDNRPFPMRVPGSSPVSTTTLPRPVTPTTSQVLSKAVSDGFGWIPKTAEGIGNSVLSTAKLVPDVALLGTSKLIGDDKSYKEASKLFNNNLKNSIPGGAVSLLQKAGNEIAGISYAASKIPEAIQLSNQIKSAQKSGDKVKEQFYRDQYKKFNESSGQEVFDYYNNISPTVTGDVGSYNTPDSIKKGDSITPAIKGVSEIAPWMLGGSSNRVTNALVQGAVGGTTNTAMQLANGQPFDFSQLGQAVAAPAAFGALMPSKSNKSTIVKQADEAHINMANALDNATDSATKRGIINDMIATQKAKALANSPELATTKYNVNKVNSNEAYTLSDYAEMLNPKSKFLKDTTNPSIIDSINQLNQQARNAANTAGIDITSGSKMDIQNRIIDFMEQYDNAQNPSINQTNVRTFTQKPDQRGSLNVGQIADDLTGKNKTKITVDPTGKLGKETPDPIVNAKTGETLSQSVKKLQDNGWSNADINKYKKAVLNQDSIKQPNPNELSSLNPTGGVYVEYTPQSRATMPLAKNMTTLDKTMKISPDEMVTIYRGAPKNQKSIAPGDFITTNKELAKSYTGDGNVIETKVPASHILDDKTSPKGEEYIYRPPESTPQVTKTPIKPFTDVTDNSNILLETAQAYADQQPLKISEDDYLKQRGAGPFASHDPAMDNMMGAKPNAVKRYQKMAQDKATDNYDKSVQLRKEYKQKVANGEITEPTIIDRALIQAKGNPESIATQSSRRILEKQGIDWQTGDTFNTTGKLGKETPKTIKGLDGKPLEVDGNDVILYHRTNKDAAKQISKTGILDNKLAGTGNDKAITSDGKVSYTSTNPGQDFYGDSVVKVKMPIDEFNKQLRVNSDTIAKLEKEIADGKVPPMYIDSIKKQIENIRQNPEILSDKPLKVAPQVTKTPKPKAASPLAQLEPEVTKIIKTKSKKAAEAVPKARGFVDSVKNAPAVDKAVKASVEGLYTPKTNDELMGEAKAMLTEGATIDFKNTKDLDKKVAATMQEAMNQQAAGNHQAAADLFNNLSEHGTELGRGVQAFSLLKNMSPEAVSLSVAGKIKKYNQTTKGKKIPELNGEQQKMIVEKMQAIDLLKDGREKNIALNELENTISDFIPSTIVDKAITVWKAGLLTSLRTHVRNFVGNTIHGIAEIAKDIPATGADILMKGKTGQRSMTFTTKGLREFASKSTGQQMKDIISKGYDTLEMVQKFDYNKITWGKNKFEQGLKKYTDTVFNLLGAEDKPFYNAAMARSLYDQAGTAAINAGKRGDKKFIENLVKNPTEEMVKIALGDANVATFKNKNVATDVVNQLKQSLNKTEAGKLIGGITMPFTGVPTSILGQIINYSPVGLVKGMAKVGKVAAGQVPELQRQAAKELGRGVIGTGVFALGAYLASQGIITGQPKDQKEARQWELENKPRNSIMIGGRWYSLNSIGPESVVFLAGAKANEEMGKKDGSTADYALKLGKDYLDQSFVRGLQSPVNALTDPERYGKSYVGQTASSVIPNIIKDVGKAFDPYQRETNTVSDYVKATIPGLRNTMLPRRDPLGNIIKQEPTGLLSFIDMFNSKTPVKNPVVNELNRLYEAGQSATPSKMTAKTSVLSQALEMTPQQLDKLEESTGMNIQQQMNDIIVTPEYQQASDEMKKSILSSITKDVRKSGKMDVLAGGTGSNIANLSGSNKVKLQKDVFEKSDQTFLEKDGYIYTRNDDGTAKATPKIKFEHDLNSATLTQLKSDGDTTGWLKQADLQIKNIYDQMQDKNINPIEAIKLQNELDSLLRNKAKYESYGGFTKGKSSSSKTSSTKQKAIDDSTLETTNTTLNKLNNLLRGTQTFTRPTVRKAQLKQITVKGEQS